MDLSAILGPLTRLAAPVAGFALGGPAGAAGGEVLGELFGGGTSTDAAPASSSGGIASLFGGPGRGQMRRDSARALLQQRPALLRLMSAIAQTGYRSAQDVADAIRAYTLRDSAAAADLGRLLQVAQQYGGIGKAQGVEANALGDVFKLIFTGEAVPKKWKPTVLEVLAALGGPSSPVAPVTYTASPVGAPAIVSQATPIAFTQQGGAFDMPTFTDAITALPAVLNSIGGIIGGFNEPGRGSGYGRGPLGAVFASDPNAVANGGAGPITIPYNNAALSTVFDPFRITARGAQAKAFVAVNPATQADEWFVPAGRPILFSRDLAVVRRVRKVATRFGRVAGVSRRVVRRRGRR